MQSNNSTKEQSKAKKILNVCINVIVVLVVVMAFIFTVLGLSSKNSNEVPKLFGQGYLTVVSGSMDTTSKGLDSVTDAEKIAHNTEVREANHTNNYVCPDGFERGDILLVHVYTSTELQEMIDNETPFKVGDIITFPTVINKVMSYNTHRIVAVEKTTTGYTYTTQGDANLSSDWDQVSHTEVLASYEKKIDSIGSVFIFLQSPTGFLVCIVLPLVILLVFEVFNFVKVFKEYRLEKNGGAAVLEKPQEKTQEELLAEIEKLKQQLNDTKKDE